jgi:hypothetical protein
MKGMFENLTVRKNRDDAVFDSNLSESLLGAGDATEDDTGRTGYAPPVLDGDRPEVSGKLKLKIKVRILQPLTCMGAFLETLLHLQDSH